MLAAIVAFAVISFLSVTTVSQGVQVAEKLALNQSEEPSSPENQDATNEPSDQGVGDKNDGRVNPKSEEKKSDEKTSTQETKEEEHKPADPDTGKSTLSPETMGLLPNPLEPYGIKFSATYIGEILGNPVGGAKQGIVYQGRLNLALDVDLAKLVGWPGASMHGNVFQIHGHSLSREYIDNLMEVSSIEALPNTRLYELWFEQKFANDKFSIRAGQLAADTEFITSKYTDVFINATYGWPTITALNLPSGGPSPPLAAVGARLKLEINDNLTALAAVFDGDAAGPGPDDPQTRNRHGLNFRINDPPFVISEMQYAYNQKQRAWGLPGTLKFGGWYHAGLFDDQRFTAEGLSRADPSGFGLPAKLRSNFGLYGVSEQMVFRFSGPEEERGIGLFGRVSGSPSDRNLIDLYADGGGELRWTVHAATSRQDRPWFCLCANFRSGARSRS
jgi:porin